MHIFRQRSRVVLCTQRTYSPSLDFLFSEAFNHFIAQVIDGLHLCSLQSQLAHFRTLNTDK